MRKYLIIFIPILLFITACNQNEHSIHATTLTKQAKLNVPKLEEVFKNHGDVYNVLAIEADEEILIAYKVRHLKRFQMKKIESELKKELKQHSDGKELIISDDFKIHLEMAKLMSEMEKNEKSIEDMKKKMKKIISLKKEVT